MTTFLWGVLVLCGVSSLGRLFYLGIAEYPREKTRVEDVIDTIVDVAFVVWSVVLLASR